MKRIAHVVSRSLFAAGMLGALGFGALQITAKPAEAAVRACFDEYCDDLCWMRGYWWGFCDTTTHQCVCMEPRG